MITYSETVAAHLVGTVFNRVDFDTTPDAVTVNGTPCYVFDLKFDAKHSEVLYTDGTSRSRVASAGSGLMKYEVEDDATFIVVASYQYKDHFAMVDDVWTLVSEKGWKLVQLTFTNRNDINIAELQWTLRFFYIQDGIVNVLNSLDQIPRPATI